MFQLSARAHTDALDLNYHTALLSGSSIYASALFLEQRMINYYSCRNFHRPMNHTYMIATTHNAIRKPSINTTIHISDVCYPLHMDISSISLANESWFNFVFRILEQNMDLLEKPRHVWCVWSYILCSLERDEYQAVVLSSITNWIGLCPGQAATARCLLPLPANWMSFF